MRILVAFACLACSAACDREIECGVDGHCEANARCVQGRCIADESVAEPQPCETKCDCELGQICVAGLCEPPPETCSGPDVCPATPRGCFALACNGFTQRCFNPAPPPCALDSDCAGEPVPICDRELGTCRP